MDLKYDIVVVGAGCYGLGAAKAYLQRHPDARLAIFESAESCGGTWSQGRLYPLLRANNMVGGYEFPDFPLLEEVYNVKPLQNIPGTAIHQYLTDFAKHFGLFDKIQFHSRVDLVQPSQSGGWNLELTTSNGSTTVETSKLIIATGLTSTPNIPQYRGLERLGIPFFHSKDFAREAPHLKDIKHAVVVGGGKSAFDVAYSMVESGATVDLLIRPTGHGPEWMAPRFVTPLKKRLDLLMLTRCVTYFAPCPFGDEDGHPLIRRFLHGTAIGRLIVNIFWKLITADMLSATDYDSHPELQKLKPWSSAFWVGTALGVDNYDTSVFDLVKSGKIRVHIDDVDHLEQKKIVLTSGNSLDADVLICATGWNKEPSPKFAGLGETGLGLPYSDAVMKELSRQADIKVLKMFPVLKTQPRLGSMRKDSDPLRLYRFMVPANFLQKRNLAFAGMVSNVATTVMATVQGEWIVTYFDGMLDRIADSQEKVMEEIMLHTQWNKWRYAGGYGAKIPDLVFETLAYHSLLMNDMNLSIRRKPSLVAELFSPYVPTDFDGLFEEWKTKHQNIWNKRLA